MPGTAEQTSLAQGQESSISTHELQAIVEGGDQELAEDALDNQSAATIKKAVEAPPSVKDTVTEAKGVHLDGLRKGVANAADTTNALLNEATAREKAGFAPDAQLDRRDILNQQRDTNAVHEEIYQQEHTATLQEAAAAQEAQHTTKTPLWNRFKNLFKRGESKTGGEA